MDRRKKGEYIGALGALLVHVAVIALLILVSFTVPQPELEVICEGSSGTKVT
jgi:hypothetical protein